MAILVFLLSLLISFITGRGKSVIWSLINTHQLMIYLICLSVTNVPDNTVRV